MGCEGLEFGILPLGCRLGFWVLGSGFRVPKP